MSHTVKPRKAEQAQRVHRNKVPGSSSKSELARASKKPVLSSFGLTSVCHINSGMIRSWHVSYLESKVPDHKPHQESAPALNEPSREEYRPLNVGEMRAVMFSWCREGGKSLKVHHYFYDSLLASMHMFTPDPNLFPNAMTWPFPIHSPLFSPFVRESQGRCQPDIC